MIKDAKTYDVFTEVCGYRILWRRHDEDSL